MPDLVGLLRRLADEYEKETAEEKAGESTKQTEQRIAELEKRIAAQPAADKADAVEELTDEEWKLIEQHRTGVSVPEPKQDPEPAPVLPRQRLTEQMPRIWSGDDEPDQVSYRDEHGKELKRPGRKKGRPYQWQVDEIPDDPAADDG